jgi:hypothetical protein
MDQFRECIERGEDQLGQGKDLGRRRVFNYIREKTVTDSLNIDRLVQCKDDAIVLRGVYGGNQGVFVKVMPAGSYSRWDRAYSRLREAGFADFHPAVVQNGMIPGTEFGFTIIEAFGESIADWEARTRSLIGIDFHDDVQEWVRFVLRRMHEHGVFHGDLVFNEKIHKGNIVFRENRDGGRSYRFIDIGSVHGDDDDAETLRKERYSLSMMRGTRAPIKAKKKRRRLSRRREEDDDDDDDMGMLMSPPPRRRSLMMGAPRRLMMHSPEQSRVRTRLAFPSFD